MVERLYTPDQACQLLGCGKTRLYRYMKDGQIPSVKLGKSRRIRKSDLDGFIEGLTDGEA